MARSLNAVLLSFEFAGASTRQLASSTVRTAGRYFSIFGVGTFSAGLAAASPFLIRNLKKDLIEDSFLATVTFLHPRWRL